MIASDDRLGSGRRLVLLCGMVPSLLVALIALGRPPFLTRADDTIYDFALRWAGTTAPDGRVVIIDVDERSLAEYGQWPWHRGLMAQLVRHLRESGAAVVALDIIFAEPERSSARGDDELANTLRQGGAVLGYGLTFTDDGTRRGDCAVHPLSVAVVHTADLHPFFRASGAVCSLPILNEAAGASGFLNAAPDRDGILRRVPLLAEHNGSIYPSLALAAVTAMSGARHVVVQAANENSSVLTLDSTQVPLDGKGNLLLRFRGVKKSFPYVSASDVLGARVDEDDLRGKVVLVGTTALGTREVVATPLDTLFVGVEVQATVVDNLLRGDFIRRPEHQRLIEAAATLIAGSAVALLTLTRGLTVGGLMAGAAMAATWLSAVWLLSALGVFVSPLFPTAGWLAAFTTVAGARFRIERRRADDAGVQSTAARALMIQALLSLTEVRDVETGRHSRRTQLYTKLLADELSTYHRFQRYLTPERIELLASLAPLHDIGKVGVPDSVLNKPGALTPDELAEMRRHPVYGRDVIVNAETKVAVRDDLILGLAKEIVYTHHERWDGKGYPQGLTGEEIPIAGRIIAVVDVYDATTTRTLYKKPLSHAEAMAHIFAGRGSHFDPAVVDAFIRVAPAFRSISVQSVAEPIPA